jgi:hypothetical protein
MQPVWRQRYNNDPFREWMRRDFPPASDGFVPIDIDNAIRCYGKKFGLDGDGDLLLIEKKEQKGVMTPGEQRVYTWLDKALKSSVYADRWRGCHLLHIQYTQELAICSHCYQPITSDADEAYARFMSAKLTYDGEVVTHDQLFTIISKQTKHKPDESVPMVIMLDFEGF